MNRGNCTAAFVTGVEWAQQSANGTRTIKSVTPPDNSVRPNSV